jgi:hypothetical protein
MYSMPAASSPEHPKVVLKKPIIACPAFSLSGHATEENNFGFAKVNYVIVLSFVSKTQVF